MVAAVDLHCALEQACCFETSSCCNECLQVVQQGLEVLCVSQFTLFNIMKGNKPDFHLAMPPTQVDLSYNSLDEQNYLIFMYTHVQHIQCLDTQSSSKSFRDTLFQI